MNANLWARLADALDALTGLPLPVDVAKIVKGHPKRRAQTDAKLARALNWLEEFNRAWNISA